MTGAGEVAGAWAAMGVSGALFGACCFATGGAGLWVTTYEPATSRTAATGASHHALGFHRRPGEDGTTMGRIGAGSRIRPSARSSAAIRTHTLGAGSSVAASCRASLAISL